MYKFNSSKKSHKTAKPAIRAAHNLEDFPQLCAQATARNFEIHDVIHKSGQHARLLEKFASAGGLDYISDVAQFSAALDILVTNPADKSEHGEKPNQVFGARCRLVEATGPSEEWDKRKYTFAAWCLWQARSSDVYLTQGQIRYFATHWALEPVELLKVVAKHPTIPNAYTTYDIQNREHAISAMLANASSLGATVDVCQGLDERQISAIKHIITSPFSALQGSAGVGKTTTVVELLRQLGNKVAVACVAFTHKARRCVEQRLASCGIRAHVSTIHAFINMINTELGHASFPHLFLLVDESSMVDIELLGELAAAIRERGIRYQLCFIGDTHQLPPVGRGEFYRQLVDSKRNLAELTVCYRTDRPDLFAGFQSIRKGELPASSANFEVVLCDDDKGVNSVVGSMISKAPCSAQFITWQNKDVNRLNGWLQSSLLKADRVGPDCYKGYYTNDRVVFVGENTESLTNAMIGTVVRTSTVGLEVLWEDGTSTAFKSQMRGLQLAYCLTVHKSQGSEYDHVIVPCYSVDKMMSCLDRRFIYTAVTRAKKTVVLIAPRHIGAFISKQLDAAPATAVRIM